MTVHAVFRLRACSAFFAMGCWLIAVAVRPALAQEWPARTITAIVPFSAGAATDIVARVALDQVANQVGGRSSSKIAAGLEEPSGPTWSPKLRLTATRCWRTVRCR
jgi:hypothetical protein